VPRHEAHDRRGVHAARKERSQWHVCDESHANRFIKKKAQLFKIILFAARLCFGLKREVPVLLDAYIAVSVSQVMAGRKLSHRAKD
jgi:hypothetical protein